MNTPHAARTDRPRRPAAAIALALLVAVLLGPVRAGAVDPAGTSADYFSIIQTARSGDPETAAERLRAFVDAHPDDTKADDALLELGRLQETELCRYPQAVATYRELIETYPAARGTRRAKRALERLSADRTGGDEPLCRYRRALSRYAEIGADAAIAEVRAIVDGYPDFGKRDEALYWIGDQYLRRGDHADADLWFKRTVAEYPKSTSAFHSLKGIGDLNMEYFADFDAAEAAFAKMAEFEGTVPYAAQAAAVNKVRLAQFKALYLAYRLALGFVILGVAYLAVVTRWKTALSGLTLRGHLDAVVYVWVAAILAIALHTVSPDYTKATVPLLVATGGVLFLGSLSIRGRQLSTVGKVTHLFVMTLLIASVLYAIFYSQDLVNVVWDTVRANFG